VQLDELQLDGFAMHEPEVQIDEPAKYVLQVAILALQGPRSPG